MHQKGLWASQRWVEDAPKAAPRRSKRAPRHTKTPLGRLEKVSQKLKIASKSLPKILKTRFSLNTSFKNQYFNNVLLKHTCATSCNCLEVLWSVLTPSWNHIGSLRKAFWSLLEASRSFKNCVFVKYIIEKWVLKQNDAKTANGDML